jgi:hypothetical protein
MLRAGLATAASFRCIVPASRGLARLWKWMCNEQPLLNTQPLCVGPRRAVVEHPASFFANRALHSSVTSC